MTPLTRRVRRVLLDRARNHDLITYEALARRVGMKVRLNLNSMLNRIHDDDKEKARPSLACIVISAEKLTMPTAWRTWGRRAWMRERARLYRYYRS
jgi:hypothetical protein